MTGKWEWRRKKSSLQRHAEAFFRLEEKRLNFKWQKIRLELMLELHHRANSVLSEGLKMHDGMERGPGSRACGWRFKNPR